MQRLEGGSDTQGGQVTLLLLLALKLLADQEFQGGVGLSLCKYWFKSFDLILFTHEKSIKRELLPLAWKNLLHQKGERFIFSLRARRRILSFPKLLLEAIYLLYSFCKIKSILIHFSFTLREIKSNVQPSLNIQQVMHY